MADAQPLDQQPTLVDVLDRLLDTGLVLDGQVVVSLAVVDLVHIGLRALVASVEMAGQLATPKPSHAPMIEASTR
jgi:hypothetical protein